MKRTSCSLLNKRAPGETGVEFKDFAAYPRALVVSSPATGEVAITVGCHIVRLTAEEAAAIAVDVAKIAKEAGANRGT